MRKLLAVSSIILLLLVLCFTVNAGDHIAILRPGNPPVRGKAQNPNYITQKEWNVSNGIIDTLTWRNEGASEIVNVPFISTGESLLVWLEPISACSLISIRFRPMNWEGHVLFNIWDADNYDPLIYSTDSTDENGWWGEYEPEACPYCWIPGDIVGHTPLGWIEGDPAHHYWGPYPFTVTDEHANTWIEISADSCFQGKVDLGSDPFFIGASFYVTAGWGFYAQESYPGDQPYTFFKFVAEPHLGGYTHGWILRSLYPWFEAIVKYYESPTAVQEFTFGTNVSTIQLFPNHPNPFNVTTDITYQLSDDRSPSPTSLRVYNLLGQRVMVLVDEVQEAGVYNVRWDGTDESGLSVGSGVYFYQLRTGDFVETKRMLLLK